jgi:regulator of protease activity HflC (stomatin/prohibitin superfamily)
MSGALLVVVVLAFTAFYVLSRVAVVVPQQNAYVVERLGQYSKTLGAGFHILVPFIQVIRYRHSLKEDAIDIPEQECITRDNVMVGVDGVLYLKIVDPERASYGIANLPFALIQLAQTTLRSEIGKLDLDRTFEERTNINHAVVTEIDKASEAWGVKVLRYEIKNIKPPQGVLDAMEKQMRAERDRRASILTAEGSKQSQILTAQGEKEAAVLKAEGAKTAAVLRAEGEAKAIGTVFDAIHAGRPDKELLSYQYLQMLPELAKGEANKLFVIPSEFTQALSGLGGVVEGLRGQAPAAADPAPVRPSEPADPTDPPRELDPPRPA